MSRVPESGVAASRVETCIGLDDDKKRWRRGEADRDGCDGAAVAWWKGRGGGVAAKSERTRRGGERMGRYHHESRGGEGSPQGKGDVRVVVSLGCVLPNDGKIWPGSKKDMGALGLGKNEGSLGGL